VTRSKPGEPPRKQTGHLRDNIDHEVLRAEKTARIGTNVVYGRFLELGTFQRASGRSGASHGLMAPRPWLRPTLAHLTGIVVDVMRRRMMRLPKD
jgi:hypothetical protein